ncbi:MAG TPA: hypothetical protein VH878_07675, partial [Thermodesulfobacteriota bacterium]
MLRIRITTAFVITVVAFAFLVFTSFIIVSEVILPDKIRTYIGRVFKSNGYEINIKNIGFNILSGVTVNEIRVSDLRYAENPITSIARI